ncbi:MAG: hypothetical protein CVU41_18425 [Chloroflexi bacterium HGW-Chloroflexi-3]|nr:MAG: hypothetical protein CVU41_18425 [Chloroflexi bacterium HGW-Chloroflexi-3]
MNKFFRLIRFDWPLHFVLFFTNWLPDNVVFLRLRGWLAHWFFGKCGSDLRIGRNVTFYNSSSIYLGSNIYFAYGCILQAIGKITIDNEVMIGPYGVISSGRHSRSNASYRYGSITMSDIFIGSGTWIGARVSVLGDTIIGNGCLLASHTCVTKGSFLDNSLIAGIPAKVIKNLEVEYDTNN